MTDYQKMKLAYEKLTGLPYDATNKVAEWFYKGWLARGNLDR